MSHGAHQTVDAYVVSLVEDFCKSPIAPVGYMICQKLQYSQFVCGTVHGISTPVLNFASRISSVVGDEAGTGGGIVSGSNLGSCRPVTLQSRTVRAEGKPVIRHGTIMEMNCASLDSKGNTLGMVIYPIVSAPITSRRQSTADHDPAKYFVDISLNDLTMVLGMIVNLPIALFLRGVAFFFPEFGAFLAEMLPETVFGTGDKSGGGVFTGNNDRTDGKSNPKTGGGQCGPFTPGVLGIAMALAHLQGFWGDEVKFEAEGKDHDSKVNPHGGSDSLNSGLETIGQGLGILARKLGFGEEFCALLQWCFGPPGETGFLRGVFNGAHQVAL